MLNEILESCKNVKMISADIKTDVKQEIKKVGSCIEVPSQNLKYKNTM